MNHIQDYCYPIFIVLTDQADISICRKRFDCSEGLVWNFTILKVGQSIVQRSQNLLGVQGGRRFLRNLLTCQENFSFLRLGKIDVVRKFLGLGQASGTQRTCTSPTRYIA